MKNNRLVLLLLLVAFLVRIAVVVIAGQQNAEHADAASYDGYAKAILQNSDWITHSNFPGNFRPPLYPMIIATMYAVFGINNFLAVYVFQAFISVLTCFYIYKFSKKIFNDTTAIVSLAWSIGYVYYLQYVRVLMRETIIFFLLLVFFYYLYLHLRDARIVSRSFWFSLISYVLLIHTDPRYLFYLPFSVFLFVIYEPFKRGIDRYFVFLILTLLLMVPWTVRNYIAYRGLVLINTGDLDLRTARNRQDSLDRLKINALNVDRINWIVDDRYPSEEERKLIKQGLNPNNRTTQEIDAVKNDVYPDSTFWARKWFQFREFWRPFRLKYEYRPFPDCRFVYWSMKHNVVSILFYGLLLPFMIYGIIRLVSQKNRIAWFLIFPLVIQTLLHVLQWAITRYRNPIDSFIIIIAAYGFTHVYAFIKGRSDAILQRAQRTP